MFLHKVTEVNIVGSIVDNCHLKGYIISSDKELSDKTSTSVIEQEDDDDEEYGDDDDTYFSYIEYENLGEISKIEIETLIKFGIINK